MENQQQTDANPNPNGAAPAESIDDTDSQQSARRIDFGLLRQVPMTVQVEVGRASLTLGEILDDLKIGSSIRLDRHPGDPVDIYVNGALFARAEVVTMNDRIGARIVQMIEPSTPARSSGLR
jgi:flagellar motor switch protein FliN/FliY